MSIEARIAELMSMHKEQLARMIAESEAPQPSDLRPEPPQDEPADEQPAAA